MVCELLKLLSLAACGHQDDLFLLMINAHTHRQHHDAQLELVSIGPGDKERPDWFSCGIHPWHISAVNEDPVMRELQNIAQTKECLAIGECGLDKLAKASIETQQHFFLLQVQLANELGKPLVIHCVRAFSELLNCLHHAENQVPVIVHGFNNNENTARLLADEGFYFSFGKALLGYDSNAARALRVAGRRRILLETDDADVTIGQVYDKASELLGISGPILEAQVQQNFETAFNISL